MKWPRSSTRFTSHSIAGRSAATRRFRSRKGTRRSGNVVGAELRIERQRSPQSFLQANRRAPAEHVRRAAKVGIVVADVDYAAILRERHDPAPTRTVQAHEWVGKCAKPNRWFGTK